LRCTPLFLVSIESLNRDDSESQKIFELGRNLTKLNFRASYCQLTKIDFFLSVKRNESSAPNSLTRQKKNPHVKRLDRLFWTLCQLRESGMFLNHVDCAKVKQRGVFNNGIKGLYRKTLRRVAASNGELMHASKPEQLLFFNKI